jgi:hypothetical protein
MKPFRWSLSGFLATVAFASGDRIVVAHWTDSPLGPLTDVLWTRPNRERVLLVPDQPSADFITAVYAVDRVEIVPVKAGVGDRWLELDAGPLEVQLKAAAGWRVPFPRPLWFTRFVEAPIARRLLGVEAYSTTAGGVHVWYRADEHRRIVTGWATAEGRDLGALAPRSSIVAVRPLLEDPSGRLDEVIRRAARERVALPGAAPVNPA